MADAVTSKVLRNGKREYAIRLTNVSDGTGEAAVVKVDISALLTPNGDVPTYSKIMEVEYDIAGMSVTIAWEHTTDDVACVLGPGQGRKDWRREGGIVDPRSAGGSGDIVLTTTGHTAGDTYDITLYVQLKA